MRLKLWKMKPISRLRMQARWERSRSWTGLPLSWERPSVRESSGPRSEGGVDCNRAQEGRVRADGHRRGRAPSFFDLEKADGPRPLAALRRPADVEDVLEPLQLDGAVDAEVGPRTLGQLGGEGHVHGDGA